MLIEELDRANEVASLVTSACVYYDSDNRRLCAFVKHLIELRFKRKPREVPQPKTEPSK